MPVLENTRHELFVQGRARGMTLADAWGAAGYKRPCATSASRALRKHLKTRERLDELLEQRAAPGHVSEAIDVLAVLVERGRALNSAAGLSSARAAMMDAVRLRDRLEPEAGHASLGWVREAPMTEEQWMETFAPAESLERYRREKAERALTEGGGAVPGELD
jgi:hypothetical protein